MKSPELITASTGKKENYHKGIAGPHQLSEFSS